MAWTLLSAQTFDSASFALAKNRGANPTRPDELETSYEATASILSVQPLILCSPRARTGTSPRHKSSRRLVLLIFPAEVIDEHLLDGLVVAHQHVADRMATDEVANFFGEIFGVIAGALERLRHKDDL